MAVPPDLPSTLSTQIDLLQDDFRRLPGTATMREIAPRLADRLREFFPASTLAILHRPCGGGTWETVERRGESSQPLIPPPPEPARPTGCTIRHSSDGLALTHRLPDASDLGILLAPEQPDVRYSASDAVRLRIFTQLFQNALQEACYRKTEKELVFSLNHRILQLNSLIDTGIEVARLDQRVSPIQLALERAASLTNASKGVARVTKAGAVAQEFRFPEQATFAGDPASQETITTEFSFGGEVYSFVLVGKESRLGTVRFEETDQLLLNAISRQVQASLENHFLLRQAVEKQKIEQDLATAATIQQRILPRILPNVAGYDIAGANLPSITVGGDYFDCIPIADGRYALIIADVAGKGISAALLVSTFHASLKAYLETSCAILPLAQKLNRVIGQAATSEKFITAFIALLTPETGEIETLNAGHPAAYWLRRGGRVEEIGVGGVPFGMLDDDFPYEVGQVTLGPGERLLLYTDGVTEARDTNDVLFDDVVPLREFIACHARVNAQTFLRELLSEIKRFTGAAPQSDDITALYLMRD